MQIDVVVQYAQYKMKCLDKNNERLFLLKGKYKMQY